MLSIPLESVPTQAPDGPDPCTAINCEDHPADPDPCAATPCTQPVDPCSVGDCTPIGFSALYRRPTCDADAANGHYFQAVYTRPTDRPSRYKHLTPYIRGVISRMNARLYDEALNSSGKTQAARYRFLCNGSSTVVVSRYPAKNKAHATSSLYSKLVNAAQAAGLTSVHAKYVIFYDGPPPTVRLPNGQKVQACGQGDVPGDDSLASTNRNDSGPDYAIVYGQSCFAPRYAMHETAHNMGAVQNSAPRSSGAFHCNDGLDVMCYSDGGSKSRYRANVCPNRERFDCGYNDYFDTAPASGSYLATHWNLGWGGNLFLSFP